MTKLLLFFSYGSSAVDSEETVAGTQGVCHMVLPDVLVLVSDEMEDGLCEEPLESLSKNSSTHFQKVVFLVVV